MGKSRVPPDVMASSSEDTAPLATEPVGLQNTIGNAAVASLMDGGPGCGYTVERGDTLWGISERFLGGGGRWPEIYGENQDVVGSDPNLIFPGQDLDVCPANQSEAPQSDANQTDAEGHPIVDMTEGGFSTEISEPTTVMSTMGELQVYPDNFQGELPAGAITASHFNTMLPMYERIAAGDSQLSIDTSNFTQNIDPATDPEGYAAAQEQAAQFQQQMLGYLGELAQTPEGLRFLEQMDASEHTTTIQHTSATSNTTTPDSWDDAQNGNGSNVTIGVNPDLLVYDDGSEDWMTERPKFGLYHEMVHASHIMAGDIDMTDHNGYVNEEWRTTGLGPWANEEFSDNGFRRAFGKDERTTYSGTTY